MLSVTEPCPGHRLGVCTPQRTQPLPSGSTSSQPRPAVLAQGAADKLECTRSSATGQSHVAAVRALPLPAAMRKHARS